MAARGGAPARRARRARARGVRGVHGGPEGKRRLRQGARDLETRSEDAARSNMIRLAVAVGLARPETRTPTEIVEAVNGNERRRAEALAEVRALQIREAETSRVLLECRERLRKTRLGVTDESETRPRFDVGDERDATEDAIGATSDADDASSEKGQTPEKGVTRANDTASVMRLRSETETEPMRDVEHRLGVARRTLARKFKRFRGIAARLVAVDEGLKKIDDAVARTKTRVVAAFGERARDRPPIERDATAHATADREGSTTSLDARSPADREGSFGVAARVDKQARVGPPLPARPTRPRWAVAPRRLSRPRQPRQPRQTRR